MGKIIATNSTLELNKTKKSSLAIISILVITILAFINVKDCQFVNWDDDRNFYNNSFITSLNDNNFWENTVEIFSNPVIGNYNPLSIWTFAVENRVFGLDDPGAWHLNNLFLHLIAIFLVFKICTSVKLNVRASFFVALLFAIHPLRVESVAWVTERKDVLYGAFFLGSLLQYIRWKYDNKNIRLVWVYLFFILSLFSKIQAVTLPIALICVDYFIDKKFDIHSIWSKIPMLALSLAFGLLGIYFLQEHGSLETNETYGIIERIFIGAYSLVVYLIKSIIPYRMSPLYPYPASIPWHFYASIVVFPLYLYAIYKSYRKEWFVVTFGLTFFLVNIVLLLQILGAGQGFIADRFTYIAYFGLFFIFGYYLDHFLSKYSEKKTILQAFVGIAFLGYSFLTFQQVRIWENSGTLWSHVTKYYKNSTLPYGNRANYYRDQGQIKKALRDYDKAISLKPSAATFNSLARVFFDHGRTRDTILLALDNYTKAINMDPNNGEYYINRGATYARLNNNELAIKDLNTGLGLKPDHATGYLNRSIMYQLTDRISLARDDIKKYLTFHPFNADIWYEKARAERILKNFDQAIQDYSTAIKYNANKPMFYYERSRTYYQMGNIENARKDFLVARSANYDKIDPAYETALGY